MYLGQKVSLIFPSYNEAENIGLAVSSFLKTKIIDELIVVDNNSTDSTAKIAKKNGAKVVIEPNQGYGFAIRKGLSSATGDYIVLAEPDGTFVAKDLKRLLKPLANYDAVLGTRTNPNFIQPGANMGFLLRSGNIVLAKITQKLFSTSYLSDCGCTFRAFKKPAIKKILPSLTVGGSHLLPEIVILLVLNNFSFFEVPVHYKPRVGTSKITGSPIKIVQVGWKMMTMILSYLFKK